MKSASALAIAVAALVAALPSRSLADASDGRLDFHWIDVEGGAATLIVTPSGESILIDAGMPLPRDRDRILKALREDAGLERLDIMVVTHFDLDHYGGVADLAAAFPIGRVLDPGLPEKTNPVWNPGFEKYEAAVGDRRTVLRAGDRLPIAKGADGATKLRIDCLGASQAFVSVGENSPQNPNCAAHEPKDKDLSQNAESTVLLVSFGDFRLLDAADLTWNLEAELVCPVDRVGEVDVYQVDHHGLDHSNNPVLVRTIRPLVAVANNGPKKGPGPATFATLSSVESIEAIYQMHFNTVNAPGENAPPERIANPKGNGGGNTIRLSVEADGAAYALTIPATGATERFATKAKPPRG